jgi:hypothetical protein
MKKRVLQSAVLTLVITFSGGYLWAQPDIEPIDPASVVEGTVDDFLLQTAFDIKNNTDQTLNVKVRRNELEIIEGTFNYFCWEQCYAPNTSVSPTSIAIEPGASVPNFYADYQPQGIAGSSFIEYCFFDENDAQIETCVTIEFRVSGSLSVTDVNRITLGNPQPNPAIENTMIPFVLNEQNQGASLVIYNLLGSEVKRVAVNGMSGNIDLQVADLNSGLYIYSFFNGNRLLGSNRLVVR